MDGKRIYAPLLQRVFDHSRKWTPSKRPERQAITLAVLLNLCTSVPLAAGAELALSATIRDAAILATFTGSRISEYAQSQVEPGTPFRAVPRSAASGAAGDHPLAFERDDFSFYSAAGVEVNTGHISAPRYVRVLFRFSKGTTRSFAYRMFASIPNSALCPVAAASRIVRRWSTLRLGPGTPLLCYLPPSQKSPPMFLLDKQVTLALRQAVCRVYPSPRHILRQHLSSISSHSLRVFACLCLKTAGWDEEAISHQLRWNSDAVKYYIRQSLIQVDAVSASLFHSAFVEVTTPQTTKS